MLDTVGYVFHDFVRHMSNKTLVYELPFCPLVSLSYDIISERYRLKNIVCVTMILL